MAQTLAEFRKLHARTIEHLHARALQAVPALRSALTREEFAVVLHRSVQSHFAKATPGADAIRAYLGSLHAADLALACACAAGSDAAWEHFMSAFRPALYAAARAVAGEAEGRDLADSLYADLYGLKEREGQRKSLFGYFHGRSKLATWLRAVLAQRHVDAVRAARRTISLDEGSEGDEAAPLREPPAACSGSLALTAAPPAPAELEPDRQRYLAILQAAITAAIGTLESRDRLRLSYYYVQDLTLAQIGRLLGEHEATVSRKLDRVRAELRRRVEHTLREEKKLSDAQILECFECARQQWPFDLAGVLTPRE
jgi:RNA polymerase sigma-70 factor (ECF subfamily)